MATKKKTTTKKKAKASKETTKKKSVSLLTELENMEQTTGKDYVNKVKDLEKILGIREVNPFGTSNMQVFEARLGDMALVDMQSLAVRVGVMPSSNRTNLKKRLTKEFNSYNRSQGVAGHSLSKQITIDENDPKNEKALKILKDWQSS